MFLRVPGMVGTTMGIAMIITTTLALADVTLPDEVVVENLRIEKSLSGSPGDAAQGRKTFADRSLGNCLACHLNSDLSDELFHGNVGPSLDGVATRWKPEQLRTIVVNAKKVFTERTIMPGFYSLDVGEDVREDLIGKTILTAQQVEDVVAYLNTLE
ncbi:sulfur oxidation c-type cytochrome SoxX [Granulosicoccus antarcticus]|uniref:Cytochrome c domain-containing protein n=1 Tax=Granulosicoccus antarcticus IMCC3135 TaxID=1192854 RepID=A0A2Z2NN67_9GAMM|nr:sulfur oxidation c-type cytochrome SoxX [Granulosicoccus antarcticus]ASJ72836.1 hypothetical protein IMCC3135_13755 [Granulosicoccus antarcticus IMCC3135]